MNLLVNVIKLDITLGTGGGALLQTLVKSLQRKLFKESRSDLLLYKYSATSVSE